MVFNSPYLRTQQKHPNDIYLGTELYNILAFVLIHLHFTSNCVFDLINNV